MTLPGSDGTSILLGGLLGATALVTVVAVSVSAARRRRRQAASIMAIDFVRNTFAGRRARGEPLELLLDDLVEALADSFKLDSAEVWLQRAGHLERVVAEPPAERMRIAISPEEASVVAGAQVSGPAWVRVWLPALMEGRADEAQVRVAPMQHSGELLGLIVAVRAKRGEHLAAEADLTLEELAREVGVGVNKARLDSTLRDTLDQLREQAVELQASRSRVVSAADAERRRIERDLHDGAQQYLVAMKVKVRLTQQLASRDPAKAQEMLEQLGTDLTEALEELRTLAHGIYPPLLSSAGLRDALAAACRRAPLPAVLDANGIGRYPPDVEAAVYFCCLEALQNAGKYAGAEATANVRLSEEEGALILDVTDDGEGFDARQHAAGAGLANMADRLGAVGGKVAITSTPGRGAQVHGAVPIPARKDQPAPARRATASL